MKKYPQTPDGRYFIVKGRRWRCSDPKIPEDIRQLLVDELMRAWRMIAAAKRAHDKDAERAARDKVQDVKVALGERGRAWWLPPTAEDVAKRTEAFLRSFR